MPELWTDATGAVPPHLLHNFALKGCHAELSQLLQLGTARWPMGGFSPLHAACSNERRALGHASVRLRNDQSLREAAGLSYFVEAGEPVESDSDY